MGFYDEPIGADVLPRTPGALLPDPAKAVTPSSAPATPLERLGLRGVATALNPLLGAALPLLPEQATDPAARVIGAAAREENAVVSALNWAAERTGFVDDPAHNPIDVIGNTDFERRHLMRFVGSRSEAETRSIMARIAREEGDDKLLDAAGFGGTVARVGMGLLDPTLFLPGGAIYKGTRAAGTVGKTALSVGAAVGAQAALSEGTLYATQETRTPGEVALNIGAGTILGGILGGAIGGMAAHEIEAATKAVADVRRGIDMEMRAPSPAPAGAAVDRRALTLESAFGVEKAAAELSPVTRLQTSTFDSAKAAVRDLADAGLSYRENWDFVPTSEGGTVETRAKIWNANLARATATLDDAYARYFFGKEDVSAFERRSAALRQGWGRITGDTGGKMSFQEFREEVGKAMARGDQHPVPHVAEAAQKYRAEVFDPLWNEAKALKLAGEADELVGAESYITRVYDRQRIIAQRDQFTKILKDHFRAQRDAAANEARLKGDDVKGFAAMDENAVTELVESVIANILGESASRLAGLRFLGKGENPLKSRVLTVPDDLLEPYLVRDIEKVSRAYVRSLAGDVELARKFGDPQMTEALAKLDDEYKARQAAAESPTARQKLEKEYKAAARDIGALRDRVRHTYGAPSDPDGMMARAGRMALQLNYLARLGGMTLSSIPDIARPVMRYGLGAFRDGWLPLINNLDAVKLSAREVRLAGTALDMVRDQRLMELGDILDDFGRGSKFERGVQFLTDRFGLVTLMSPWNGAVKSMAGVITMAEVLRATKAVAGGKPSAKQIQRLAADGVDEAMARRIWAEAEKSGNDVNGVFLPNTEDWTDMAAVQAFRAVVNREVDSLIVTPGLEKPLWMSKPLGRIIGQFKSFAAASTQRTMLAGLQQKDAAALAGVMSALALGAVTAKIKGEVRGEDTKTWGPGRWAAEAIDNSGLFGLITEAGNIADKWTGGKVGLARLGGKEVSRYQSRNAVGALLGPTFDFAGDLAQVTRAAATGEVTRSDVHALRQVLPYSNLFYMRGLFDKAEEAIGDRLGLPAKRERRH